MKRFLTFLTIVFLSVSGFGQLRSPALEDAEPIDSSSVNKVQLHYNHLNFFKNNEYFNNIVYGYTLFGTIVNPQLSYTANKHLRMDGGVFLRKDFGTNGFKTIAPTLSIQLAKNGYSCIFGNIDGSLNHRLIEPLYDYERLINNKLETGFQFKINKKKVWLDTWMDWRKQIYQNSPFREEIAGGLSSVISPFNSEKKISFTFPLQATVLHRGGQIDTDTNSIQTIINTAAGFKLEWKNTEGIIKKVSTENYYVYYKDASNVNKFDYISGDGYYANVSVESKYGIHIMASYWRGEYFMAPYGGGYLYQSVSTVPGSVYTEDNRDLILVRLLYQKELFPGLHLDARFEPYYDISNKTAEYSYSLYITYRRYFDLTSPRPSPKERGN